MSKNKLTLEQKLKWQRNSDLITLGIWFPVLIPLTACVLAVSFIDCGIPTTYKQKRVGHMGREFNIIKARTMKDLNRLDPTGQLKIKYETFDAEEKAIFDNKYRISRIGRAMRKSRLDELPQILNILKGEMSFVGPRPHKVEDSINLDFSERKDLRPGLTGPGKIEGFNVLSHNEEGHKDIKLRSIFMESSLLELQLYRMKIFFKTPFALWTKRKSPDAYMHKTL